MVPPASRFGLNLDEQLPWLLSLSSLQYGGTQSMRCVQDPAHKGRSVL